MKKITILFLSVVLIMVLAARAQSELVFGLDIDGDGIPEPTPDPNYPYDITWMFDIRPQNVSVYVSNVPNPGLIFMGIDLAYDPSFFRVLSAGYNRSNWHFGQDPDYTSTPGLVDDMRGGRLGDGLSGDNIRLGTVELICIKGLHKPSEIWLYDSDRGGSFVDFVLADGTVLDPIEPILLARVDCGCIPCPGDFDDDGDVDGADLATFAADFGRMDCQTWPPCEGDFDDDGDVDGSDLAIFAEDYGSIDCPIGH